jgi:ribosome-binding factor A
LRRITSDAAGAAQGPGGGGALPMPLRARGAEPSQRQLRVAEQIRHVLAEDLSQGAPHDPRLEGVSVTIAEVRVSPDLKHAVVFATELGRDLSGQTLAALEHAAPRLAGRIARRMHLKYAPRLRFVADESFAEAARIHRLIADELDSEQPRGAPRRPGEGEDG